MYKVFAFLLFPFFLIWKALLSIWNRKSSNIEAFQSIKKFEILLEANCQVAVSGLVIMDGIGNGWIQYVSFSFSLISLMHGVWSLTENMADSSAHIKTIKKMGRLRSTMTITSAPLAFVNLIWKRKNTKTHVVIYICMLLLSFLLIKFREMVYIIVPQFTKNVVLPRDKSFWKLWLIILPDILLLVWGLYVYIDARIVITGLFEQIVFVYLFLIEQTLLVVFNTLHLTYPDLFYLEKTDDDAADEDDVEEGEAGEGESQNHDADDDVDEQPGDQLLNNKNTVGAIEVDTELVNQRRQAAHDGAGAVVEGNGIQDIANTQV